jgi:hypothetical protein
MIRAIVFFYLVSCLYGQSVQVFQFPSEFQAQEFSPDIITTGPGEWFFYLDSKSRMLAARSPAGNFLFAGGFGNDYDAFYDPVGLTVSNLDLFVCDRSEKRILRYDYKLNYTGSIVLDPYQDGSGVYIDKISTDPWGYYYLYSADDHLIRRGNVSGIDRLPFLDLNQQTIDKVCLESMVIAPNGDIGLLFSCTGEVVIFNRLGRIKTKLMVAIPAPSKLQYVENKWIVVNAEGQGQILDHLEKSEFSIPIRADEKLLDCAVNNRDLICLTNLRMLVLQFE